MKIRKCILCHRKKIYPHNKSGYCKKCYRKSPQYLKYQREFQATLRFTPKHIKRVAEYNNRPEVIERKKKYMKKWIKIGNHREKMREKKRIWANKPENRAKRKIYVIERRKKNAGKKV